MCDGLLEIMSHVMLAHRLLKEGLASDEDRRGRTASPPPFGGAKAGAKRGAGKGDAEDDAARQGAGSPPGKGFGSGLTASKAYELAAQACAPCAGIRRTPISLATRFPCALRPRSPRRCSPNNHVAAPGRQADWRVVQTELENVVAALLHKRASEDRKSVV